MNIRQAFRVSATSSSIVYAAHTQLTRYFLQTYTLPYVPTAPHMYSEITNKFYQLLNSYMSALTRASSSCSVNFQPLPAIMGKQSEARGGNAMGLRGDDPDRMILEMQCSWADKGDDEILYGLSQELTDWLGTKVAEWTQGEHKDLYLPLFMNDATYDQNVTGSYRDYAKFRDLQKSMDPHGLFSKRAGGFTY